MIVRLSVRSFLAFATTLLVLFEGTVVSGSSRKILVVGSLNADTFLPVARLPTEGENIGLSPHDVEPVVDVPGGKGCNQAIAVAKLSSSSETTFVGRLGDDAAGDILKEALTTHGVDVTHCGVAKGVSSGRGYVFLTPNGQVSAVVSGGSNQLGWNAWKPLYHKLSGTSVQADQQDCISEDYVRDLLKDKSCLLLQREIPEFVNEIFVTVARKHFPTILIMQDIGGEDRPMAASYISKCDYLMPNESELNRLVQSCCKPLNGDIEGVETQEGDMEHIVACARRLQNECGAKNVLVTLGARGSLLVCENGKTIISQDPCMLSASLVVDETGAGDCYRAAIAVALTEQDISLQKCMQFASAAGALAVMKRGAVPSIPTQAQVHHLCAEQFRWKESLHHETPEEHATHLAEDIAHLPRGGWEENDNFPLMFGSRLNSMKDRPELWEGKSLVNAKDWVKRQGTIRGLTCVDFNYPQHFGSVWANNTEAKACLDAEGLKAGSVCLRYPAKFMRGAMNHPDAELRQEAIDLTKEAAQVARDLGCNEVVVWSAYDGYDYPFQVDYDEKWQQLVDAFQECCDAYLDIKFSLEFKPTDENTRFFTVPSTGTALLLVQQINRSNMGLTLDVGHMLMAGENPGQSIAMVGQHKKLFGIQLNDGYTRLAAEDGLMFASVHPGMALEIIYQLQRTGFDGHLYFDTFPQRTDPVNEAEYNIQRVKAFWRAAKNLDSTKLTQIANEHDALGALELVNQALRDT